MPIVLFVILFIVLSIFCYVWYRVHKSLMLNHFPNHETPATYELPYETRTFKNAENVPLDGWYVKAKHAKTVLLIVHGYRDVKGTVVKHAAYLHKAGYSSFIIDLSSDTPGHKTTLGIKEYKDIVAAYHYMKTQPENVTSKIGIFGGSMGASTGIIASGRNGIGDFIIATVPYANYKSLILQRLKLENLPIILFPFTQAAIALELGLNYASFAPEKLIKKIHKPILFIGAANDRKVSSHDTIALYDQAHNPKYLWNADAHHDVYKEFPDEFEKRVVDFLKTVE